MSRYTSQCLPLLNKCASSGSNSDCENADDTCYNVIEGPLSEAGNFDVYDVRNVAEPSEQYVTYLQTASVVKAIGAQSTYQECPDAPYNKFTTTGDDSRSFLSQLSSVVSSGITTLIWAGGSSSLIPFLGKLVE